MKEYEEIKEEVKKVLSEKRFYHSQCVEDRCIEFANIYGIDKQKAKLIGIAHDIAKEMPNEEKIEFMKSKNLEINEIEQEYPGLLHGIIGAIISKEKFDFDDEMVEAIKNHTTGKQDMSLLSEILFVADACGVDRKYEGTLELYELAKQNLNAAVVKCMDRTIIERINKEKAIDIKTIEARNSYLRKIQNISK